MILLFYSPEMFFRPGFPADLLILNRTVVILYRSTQLIGKHIIRRACPGDRRFMLELYWVRKSKDMAIACEGSSFYAILDYMHLQSRGIAQADPSKCSRNESPC